MMPSLSLMQTSCVRMPISGEVVEIRHSPGLRFGKSAIGEVDAAVSAWPAVEPAQAAASSKATKRAILNRHSRDGSRAHFIAIGTTRNSVY